MTRLCGYEMSPGTMKQIHVPVTEATGLTLFLLCGKLPGRTLAVTAGVHGCEYNGIEALRRLSAQVDPEKLSGNLILLPLANREGFYQGAKQIVPQDGINLNRAFPGDPSGSLSARLARKIEELIYPSADFLLDLHGGDCNERAMAFAYFSHTAPPETRLAALAGAQALSLPYRVRSTATNGLYSCAAHRGLPALLLERGGAGIWTEEEVGAYMTNVYQLMEHLEILPPSHQKRPAQTEIEQAIYLEASHDGFWYPQVREGQTFQAGMTLGSLRDLNGNLLEEFHADHDGIVLYYTFALGVRRQDPLIAYGCL